MGFHIGGEGAWVEKRCRVWGRRVIRCSVQSFFFLVLGYGLQLGLRVKMFSVLCLGIWVLDLARIKRAQLRSGIEKFVFALFL